MEKKMLWGFAAVILLCTVASANAAFSDEIIGIILGEPIEVINKTL
jgi:hypothetical protein